MQVPVDSPELTGLQMAMDEYVRRNPNAGQAAVTQIKAYAQQFISGLAGSAA